MKAAPTTTLLVTVTMLGALAALAGRCWAVARTDSPLLQVLAAAVAYYAAVRTLGRLIDAEPRMTLARSVHLLCVPVVVAALLAAACLAAAVTAGEARVSARTDQPAWGVHLAYLARKAIRPAALPA